MKFNGALLAKGWRSVAVASGADKYSPAFDHAVYIEQYSTGVRLVATDTFVILHTWVPTLEAEEELEEEPAWEEAPLATAVALDPHGRAKGFMAHAQQLAGSDDMAGLVDITLDLGVKVVERDAGSPAMAGLEPRWCVMEMRKRERVQLRLYEGEWPNWRALFDQPRPKATRMIGLNLDIVGRLEKLSKIQGANRLGWTFHGPDRMARIELLESWPAVIGLVMPSRWDLANNQPAAVGGDEPDSTASVVDGGEA